MSSMPLRQSHSRGRYWVFVGLALGLSVLGVGVSVWLLDLYLHQRYANSAGTNYRGYRGSVLGSKSLNEKRIAMIGGSTTFGYGVSPEKAIPALLEKRLSGPRGVVSVANLGLNNLGAFAYRATLEDYDSLEFDTVIFYGGYNDLGKNWTSPRRASPIFRLFGYYPILPTVFREKAFQLRFGRVGEGYIEEGRAAPRANFLKQAAAAGLETVADVSTTLEQQLGNLAKESSEALNRIESIGSCSARWQFFCGRVGDAIEYAFSKNQRVLFVTQPYIDERHRDQQANLRNFFQERFQSNPRFRYLNLGDAINLKDKALAFDGMHLTLVGNQRVAQALAVSINELQLL